MKEENYESYIIEDDEKDDAPRLTMWSIIPRVMVTPESGWDLARRKGPSPDIATLRFLLPFCLVTGASNFLCYLYPGQHTFAGILVGAVITFCSFFLSYYVSVLCEKLFLPKEARDFPFTQYGKLLTMTGVASLAFFHILTQALPMLDVILEFLPLWTIFIVYSGMKNAGYVYDKQIYIVGVICIVIVCSPVLVEWLFSLFV